MYGEEGGLRRVLWWLDLSFPRFFLAEVLWAGIGGEHDHISLVCKVEASRILLYKRINPFLCLFKLLYLIASSDQILSLSQGYPGQCFTRAPET